MILTIAVGIFAFVLSRPKPGTIEWHKKEYLAAAEGPSSVFERFSRMIDRIRGRGYVYAISNERLDRIKTHQSALIQLGFLEKRDFVVTNVTGMSSADTRAYIRSTLQFNAAQRIPEKRLAFVWMENKGTHVIIVAPREDLPKWEQLVQELDEFEGPEANAKAAEDSRTP